MAATIDGPTLTPEQEQEKWLGEAIRGVKERSAFMRAGIKANDFTQVLKYASMMLSEMRTGMLSPQHYYELYVKVGDELRELEAYFLDIVNNGRKAEDLYELVQHTGTIVPRMYLMIIMGAVYIRTRQGPCRELLRDLVEMCKGVQHPTRGLFLRHFLSTTTKNLLPDSGNTFEGPDGSIQDSVDFVIQNFKETVWLWVRMEAKSVVANKAKRDRERKELRVLVGFNLVRLSQLDGIDKSLYQSHVLPRILNIVLQYKDPIAQQYLLEVIIQVFPDEFHLFTLNELLTALATIVDGVDVHYVLTSLMDRLGNYAVALREGTAEAGSRKEEKVIRNMFSVFQNKISELMGRRSSVSASAYAEMHHSLLKLVFKTYPGAFDRVDEILGSLRNYFSASNIDADSTRVLRKTLEYVVDEVEDINQVLDLSSFDGLISVLNFKARRDVALAFASAAVRQRAKIGTQERVAKLFDIVSPITRDAADTPQDKSTIYICPEEDFRDEMNLFCRLIHCIYSDDLQVQNKLLSALRKQVGLGGMERMKFTLVPTAFSYMRLALRVKKNTAEGQEPAVSLTKLFNNLHHGDSKAQGILEVLRSELPQTTLNIYLQCANAADTCEMPEVAYAFYAEAFTMYEETAADTKIQMQTLGSMISSLCSLRAMDEETYENIALKLTQYSSKLLKKQHQAVMVAACSHMFWKKSLSETFHTKVLDCLKRSLKIIHNSQTGMQVQVALLIEALNHYLYYYGAQCPHVAIEAVNSLCEAVATNIKEVDDDDGGDGPALKPFYLNTKKYVLGRGRDDDRWRLVKF